jgi:hypothetical protein
MNLEEKLYTSTEVAEILGVSLRSVYRYLEEEKLKAEIKTATGRLRFTRQNIMDFLRPQEAPVVSKKVPQEPARPSSVGTVVTQKTPQEPVRPSSVESVDKQVEEVAVEVPNAKEDSVDWLSRFRSSADKYRSAAPMQTTGSDERVEVKGRRPDQEFVSGLTDTPMEEGSVEEETVSYAYYRSMVGGLKDIAQSIDKSSRRAGVDYAFTLNAGLSLIRPLKDPFSLLHVYVKGSDREFFEKMLRLSPSDEDNAQICLMLSDEEGLYSAKVERHGLYVVSNTRLKEDLVYSGEDALAAVVE